MTGGRFPPIVGTVSVTVFVTVIAGIILWIVAFLVVSKSEQALEFFGLMGRSWPNNHHILIDMITAAVWVPVITFLAVRVYRHALAEENGLTNGGEH